MRWNEDVKPTRFLGQILYWRPTVSQENKDIAGAICSIHCRGNTSRGQCGEFYIGETERSLKAGFVEHRRSSLTSSKAFLGSHCFYSNYVLVGRKNNCWPLY